MQQAALNRSEEEHVYLDDARVKVTGTRVILPGLSYAISNIVSVRHAKVERNPNGPIALAVGTIALGALVGAMLSPEIFGVLAGAAVVGGLGCFSAWAWHDGARDKFVIMLGTAAGEVQAISTDDETFSSAAAIAIDQAIADRG